MEYVRNGSTKSFAQGRSERSRCPSRTLRERDNVLDSQTATFKLLLIDVWSEQCDEIPVGTYGGGDEEWWGEVSGVNSVSV